MTIPCSSTRAEAFGVSFRHGNQRHSHGTCDETTEQGKRKVLIRDPEQHFLWYITCHFLRYITLHRQFCWFPIPPSILKKCLSFLYVSRDNLKAGFTQLCRDLGTLTKVYNHTEKRCIFCVNFCCKLGLKWFSPSYWKFLTYVTWIYNITRDKPKTRCNTDFPLKTYPSLSQLSCWLWFLLLQTPATESFMLEMTMETKSNH